MIVIMMIIIQPYGKQTAVNIGTSSTSANQVVVLDLRVRGNIIGHARKNM